ncbi:MAG: Gfo/Idh/MocA family oxidoreductase [Alphaproteobacteria bacterium]
MKTVTIGVIGLGVGERHIAGYRAIDGVHVKAVCDIDPEKLRAVADRCDVPDRHTDYRKLLADPEIDAVSICSYDDAHADQAELAFKSGKHVMVEKPVALNRQDLERVVRAQQDSGLILTSNLILRQSPRFIELQKQVENGDLGDLFYLEGDYLHQILWKITKGWRGRMPFYCVTYGGGIHLIDLLRWIAGREVTEVTAMAAKRLTANSAFPYPDTMTTLMRFEDEILAKSTTAFGTQRPIMHTLNVYGSKASFENASPTARFFTGDRPEDETAVTTPYPAIEKGDLLPAFVEAVRTGGEARVSARDVVRVMDICFAAWDAVEQRRTVPVTYTL